MTCTDKISRDNMLYTEPLPEIEWTLRDGTREVIGYDCRRATCRFRGRDYEAWYTEELPLATGPWKFHGLPGLILAVNDTGDDGGIIRFEATRIRRAEVPVTMADLNYLTTSRKKFMATERKFMTDPIGYMQANSNIRITVRNEGRDAARGCRPAPRIQSAGNRIAPRRDEVPADPALVAGRNRRPGPGVHGPRGRQRRTGRPSPGPSSRRGTPWASRWVTRRPRPRAISCSGRAGAGQPRSSTSRRWATAGNRFRRMPDGCSCC